MNCSNDERLIFFTFEEVKDQASKYLVKQPAIFLDLYQTKNTDLSLLLLIGQSGGTFYILASLLAKGEI